MVDEYGIEDAIRLVARREERLERMKREKMSPALMENGERLIQEAWQNLTDLLWQNDVINLQEVFEKLRRERNVAWGVQLIQKRVNERVGGSHLDELLVRICVLLEETLRSRGIDADDIRLDRIEETWKEHVPELYELWRLVTAALRDFEELIQTEEAARLLDVIRETYPEALDPGAEDYEAS